MAEGQKASGLANSPTMRMCSQQDVKCLMFAGWERVQGAAEGQLASLGQATWPIARQWEHATQQDVNCLLFAGWEWVQGTAEGQHASLGCARCWSTR